jgi:hypothetical protein
MRRIEFHWKLDPVAVAALVLSLIAAAGQFVDWARGPSIRLIAPDRIALYSDVAPDGSIFVRVAAHMSYANVAQAPYGDLVLRERVQLRAGTLTSKQQWNAFGTIVREGIKMTEPAGPQPLPGQSAVSHFTLFAPTTIACQAGSVGCNPTQEYLQPEALTKQLASVDKLQFRFEIELIDGNRISASCRVPLSTQARQQLSSVRTSYAYLLCYPDRT